MSNAFVYLAARLLLAAVALLPAYVALSVAGALAHRLLGALH